MHIIHCGNTKKEGRKVGKKGGRKGEEWRGGREEREGGKPKVFFAKEMSLLYNSLQIAFFTYSYSLFNLSVHSQKIYIIFAF